MGTKWVLNGYKKIALKLQPLGPKYAAEASIILWGYHLLFISYDCLLVIVYSLEISLDQSEPRNCRT